MVTDNWIPKAKNAFCHQPKGKKCDGLTHPPIISFGFLFDSPLRSGRQVRCFKPPPKVFSAPRCAALRALRIKVITLHRQKKRRLERRVFNDNVEVPTLSAQTLLTLQPVPYGC